MLRRPKGGLKVVVTVALTIVAVVLWFVLVRRVPERTASATIVGKTLRGASTYQQQMVGAERGLRAPAEIPLAEADVFELNVEGLPGPVLVSFNTVKGRQFEPGQRVSVRYVQRRLPFFGQRVIIVDMQHADSY
jgi:hypothetical protein